MSALTNYIKSRVFNRDAFAFFTGYLFVAIALRSGIFIVLGGIGFFIFYLLLIAQNKDLK